MSVKVRLGTVGVIVFLSFATACGGQTTGPPGSGGSSGGSGGSSGSGSSSGAGFGCGGESTVPHDVDPTRCEPQLESATSCNGSVCSWNAELPCPDDAGPGVASDSGAEPCVAWCNAAAPPGTPPSGFCTTELLDGGPAVLAHCGGCGI